MEVCKDNQIKVTSNKTPQSRDLRMIKTIKTNTDLPNPKPVLPPVIMIV